MFGDVFPLTLDTANKPKMKYLLHMLDEFAPQWKTVKLEKNVWTNFIRFYIPKNIKVANI